MEENFICLLLVDRIDTHVTGWQNHDLLAGSYMNLLLFMSLLSHLLVYQ